MSASSTAPAPAQPREKVRSGAGTRRRVQQRRTSLFANGEPMVWLTGGSLGLALLMITGLLALVFGLGFATFWPSAVQRHVLHSGAVRMGELSNSERYRPDPAALEALPPEVREAARRELEQQDGWSQRELLRVGNYELSGEHYAWVSDYELARRDEPEWALVVERMTWGRGYGLPREFRVDGRAVASDAAGIWARFEEEHPLSRERWRARRELEQHAIGEINARIEAARLKLRERELEFGRDDARYAAAERELAEVSEVNEQEFTRIREQIDALDRENARYELVLETAAGETSVQQIANIVRAYPANRLDWLDKLGVYASRWREFLVEEPREANSEGGVMPAIFGTVAMTLIMSLAVVPFGVLAALYLREYAKAGLLVSIVRIAINNLAGVPSVVFGVFGLGFFCYIFGASIDELLFSAKLPNPTYGKGGVLWASLTLALLTLPVVIVATEEALAAVPGSMREGSYACGATKWQTIQRIVLPRAMPGIMTGMVLAIARGAGEVAPLMLVGAVKLAPELPIEASWPFLHPERSFMHLGFHIYDLGFQSQNSEAAKPMVYTTTMLLISLIVALNLAAIWIRARLRRRFAVGQV